MTTQSNNQLPKSAICRDERQMDRAKNGQMEKGQIGCVWPMASIIDDLPSVFM
jgi:hypothetical protein